MRNYNATQLAIAASNYKKVSWLFTVVDSVGPTTYYWSTITRSYGGHDYTYKIDPKSFRGIELNSTNTEHNIVSPSDLAFVIDNSGNILSASDFIGGTVLVNFVVSDGTNEEIMVSCKYRIKRCEAIYQTLKFTCESLIQEYLDDDYPNTTLVKDIIPSNDPDIDDGLCVPVPIGQCYIPLRSLYIVDQRYYLLGLATGNVYDITKVRSPRKWGAGKSEWDSASYSFTQYTKTIDSVDWRVFQAIIADSDGDGVADANGLWQQGDYFLDMPTQLTKDNTRWISGDQTRIHDGADNAAILSDSGASWGIDKLIGAYVVNRTDGSYGLITDNDATTVTATLTGGTDNDWDAGDSYTIGGPASCIKWICEDKGISSSIIDDTSFAIAEKTFASWGLAFNGPYDHKKPFSQRIALLLLMCHSTLQFTDKVELHVLSKTSQKTVTKADVLRTSEVGPGTFNYSLITQKQCDSGYIEFQVANESQDKFIKKLVPAKTTTDNISSSILRIPFVQDTQDVQRIGTLKYQREFTPKANISFTNKAGSLLAIQPDDVITINEADYGGTYPVVVKSMVIKHNQSEGFSIGFQCTQYSVDLDDWEDLSPAVISIGQDDSTVVFNATGNRVFSVQPYPPYDVGDLWAGGSLGDIKRCITARASGSYAAGDWELASKYDKTSNQFAQSLGSIDSATVNFNGRNDRDDSVITVPEIAADGTAIDHTINTDGSADISFEWSWGGTESDIDGFVVYVRGSTSSASYDFGTTPSEEITFYCRPDRRHFILKGVAANLYWTFGVSAYRVVDPDVNSSGAIATAIIQPSLAAEDPYRPSANVAFAGNITGTVNDKAVSSVVYHDGTLIKRTDGTGVDADSLPESTARKWAGETGADVTNYEDTRVANAILDSDCLTVAKPIGGAYSGSGTNTGAIVVHLPQGYTDTMMSFFIDVYNFEDNISFSIFVSGYNHSTGPAWICTTANLLGSTVADNRVRFGNDGSKCCVIIGDTDSDWSYPKVTVHGFRAGYSNYSVAQWETGWDVTIESDLTGYTTDVDYSDALIDANTIKNQGDLATTNEADANVLNMTNGPAQAGADVTGDHSADVDALQTTNGPAEAGATVGAIAGTNLKDSGGTVVTDGDIIIHRGTTAPTDTARLWIDTNVTPNLLKRYDSGSSAWVKVTPENSDIDALQTTNGPAQAAADKTSSNTAANIAGQGDLATKNEVDANVLNMTNAPAEAGADVTNYEDTRVANAILDSDCLTVAKPIGGAYSGSGTNTGAIVVHLPQGYTDTMMSFFIDVYNFEDNISFSIFVSGYNYSDTPAWIRTTANLLGSTVADNRVRFGNDGSKCCVIIGDTDSDWSYPKVTVHGFRAGYSNYSVAQWETGWDVTIESDLTGYTTDVDYSDALIDANLANNTTFVNDSVTEASHAYDVHGIQRFYQLDISNFRALEFYDSSANLAGYLEYAYPSLMTFEFGGDYLTITSQKNIWMNTGHLNIPALVPGVYTLTDNYTIPDYSGQLIYTCNAVKAITVTLLDITNGHSNQGVMVIIKDISGNASTYNITIDPYGDQTVEGNSNYVINTNYGEVILISGDYVNDGDKNWYIVGVV